MSKLEGKVGRIVEEIWEDASCLSKGDVPHHYPQYYRVQIMEAISKHMAECPRLEDTEQVTVMDNTGSVKDAVITGAIAQRKLCEEHLLKGDTDE